MVARYQSIRGGTDSVDVIEVPPDAMTTLGSFGVGSVALLQRVTVMTEACEVLADETLVGGFEEGGLVVVDDSLEVSFQPGGNPASGEDPEPTTRCASRVGP
jgi:hypothetical protein